MDRWLHLPVFSGAYFLVHALTLMVQFTWRRQQMETFSVLLALQCLGNSPVTPHKGLWCGALMFSLICAWINNWENNREAGDLRCHRSHYDVTVMTIFLQLTVLKQGFSLQIIMNNVCLNECLFILLIYLFFLQCLQWNGISFSFPWLENHVYISEPSQVIKTKNVGAYTMNM